MANYSQHDCAMLLFRQAIKASRKSDLRRALMSSNTGASVQSFYQIELNQLIGEFNKISLFTNHAPTLGSYRESVLKAFLRKFVPLNLAIESGFVFDHINADPGEIYNQQTKQIDCLIYDRNNFSQFLRTQDFAIISPASLYGAIEVKSTLTLTKEFSKTEGEPTDRFPWMDISKNRAFKWSGTLIDALENIKSLHDVVHKFNTRYFAGIFSYSASFDWHTFAFALGCTQIQRQLGITHLSQLPTYICVPNAQLAYFGRVSMFESDADGFNPEISEITVIEGDSSNSQYSLQFFANALKGQMDYSLIKKMPDDRGLFAIYPATIKHWRRHFDLCSE